MVGIIYFKIMLNLYALLVSTLNNPTNTSIQCLLYNVRMNQVCQ